MSVVDPCKAQVPKYAPDYGLFKSVTFNKQKLMLYVSVLTLF